MHKNYLVMYTTNLTTNNYWKIFLRKIFRSYEPHIIGYVCQKSVKEKIFDNRPKNYPIIGQKCLLIIIDNYPIIGQKCLLIIIDNFSKKNPKII